MRAQKYIPSRTPTTELMKLQHARFALLALLVVFGSVTYRNQMDWGDDWAQYLDQANWLLNSNFKAPVHYFVYQHTSALYAPPYYPWGWPLLLALTAKLPPAVVLTCLWAGFSLVLFEVYRLKTKNVGTALAWALVWAVSPWMLRFKWEWLSDLPFALCTTALIFVLLRPKQSKRTLLLIGLLTAASIAFRPLGWALVLAAGAAGLGQWVRNRRISQSIGAVLVGGGVSDFLLSILPHASGHFTAVYGPPWLISGVLDRLVHYFGSWRYAWSPVHSWFPGWGLWIGTLAVLTVVAAWTYALLTRKQNNSDSETAGIPIFFAAVYAGAVVLFPVQSQGFRYLLPLVPWMFPRILPVKFSLGLALLVLFSYLPAWAKIASECKTPNELVPGPHTASARELLSEIHKRIPLQDTLHATRPRALAHLTHRWSVFSLSSNAVAKPGSGQHWWVTSTHWPTADVPIEADLVWSNSEFALFCTPAPKYTIVH